MRNDLVRTGFFGALALAVIGCAVWVSCRFGDEGDDGRAPSRKRRFSVEMAEGFALRRPGYYGVDFVRCGKCRIEKRKIGGFSIGCFNELVLEDLSVVIPPDSSPSNRKTGNSARKASAKDLAAAIGVNADLLKSHGWRLRFSGLRISNLSVSTLDASSNAVPRFVAVSGVAKTDGLHLQGCGIICRKETNCVGCAVVKIKPQLRLEWAGGELPLY